MLGAIAIDFIDQLKSNKDTKGWSISPLTIHPNYEVGHGGLLPVKPIPNNISPVDAYVKDPPQGRTTFIKVKVPKKALRLIGLSLYPPDRRQQFDPTKPIIYLSFWRANGWIQHERINRRRQYNIAEPPDGYNTLLIYRIFRVSKTSKKKATIVHTDSFDVSIPEMCQRTIETVVQVIKKSFEWRGRKSEKFGHHEPCFMINLDGHNYECEEYRV